MQTQSQVPPPLPGIDVIELKPSQRALIYDAFYAVVAVVLGNAAALPFTSHIVGSESGVAEVIQSTTNSILYMGASAALIVWMRSRFLVQLKNGQLKVPASGTPIKLLPSEVTRLEVMIGSSEDIYLKFHLKRRTSFRTPPMAGNIEALIENLREAKVEVNVMHGRPWGYRPQALATFTVIAMGIWLASAYWVMN